MKSFKAQDDIKNSACRCVQQEMDLSELTWMDTSSYKSIQQVLKRNTSKVNKVIALSKPQMDLFV